MAYRAGAEVANLEFVQFHPTALYPAGERAFLISEAVRGEGAVLRTIQGEALMTGVHPLGSLAPRDVVARAVDVALKESGDPHVLLDLSPISTHEIERRFPGILAECARRGLDIRREAIPVVPAAHYVCGGVRTDLHGRTTVAGLFAAGEVACTGVHGANRLASNSLLEAVVYSHRAAQALPLELALAASLRVTGEDTAPPPIRTFAHDADRAEAERDRVCERDELRNLMWQHAAIVRSGTGLAQAAESLAEMRARAERAHRAGADPDGVEFRNLTEVARLIVQCARSRRESRGLHYTLDHPYRDNERYLRDTRLVAA
jgi:L-aspartate oxidase